MAMAWTCLHVQPPLTAPEYEDWQAGRDMDPNELAIGNPFLAAAEAELE